MECTIQNLHIMIVICSDPLLISYGEKNVHNFGEVEGGIREFVTNVIVALV